MSDDVRAAERSGGCGWRPALVLGATIALKFVLVSHHEIAVKGNDDAGFAAAGAAGYWGAAYGPYTHVRQPVYPLFLHATSSIGMPARLAIEGVWCLACAVMMLGLRAAGLKPWPATAVAAATAIHPWTLSWFDRLAQDGLYAALALMFAVSIGAAVGGSARRWRALRWGTLAAASGALAANTRPEGVLLHIVVAAAVVWVVVRWRMGGMDSRQFRRRFVAAVVLPLAAMQGLSWALALKNENRIGIAATSDIAMPGLVRLYDALLAIPPPDGVRQHDPRLPIASDVRKLAYAASPTFAGMREWLDGTRPRPAPPRECRRQTGARGEYGAWTVWAVRAAAWERRRAEGGAWNSAGELDAFFGRAADELRAAMREGRLASRSVPVSFVPPEWVRIARALPGSVLSVVSRLALVPVERARSPRHLSRLRPLFNSVAVRRAAPAALVDGDFAGARAKGGWWYGDGVVGALSGVERGLAVVYRGLMVLAMVVAGAGLVLRFMRLVSWWRHRRSSMSRTHPLTRSLWERGGGPCAVLWTALLGRVMLVGLMDVTGVPVATRYLLFCPPLIFALAAFSAQAFGTWSPSREPAGRG